MKEEILGAKIVVIGGGTGSFAILSGLKNYTRHITALVNMADDGGSTGQLRDELGVLPPGDVRQCLVALSQNPKVRDLFTYRFPEGTLKGHAVGNLFLAALEQMSGSFAEAVELASQVLNIIGKVEPITLTNVTLCTEGVDGAVVRGQHEAEQRVIATRPKVWLEPEATANPQALTAIAEADIVVIAPGLLYGSLAPALVVPGVYEALKTTKAKKAYIANLVTKPGPTDGFYVHDFADEIERLAGGEFLDYVIYNSVPPTQELIDKYAHQGEYGVAIDETALQERHYKAKAAKLLSMTPWQGAQAGDPLAHRRSYIRHDPDQSARAIMRLYFA